MGGIIISCTKWQEGEKTNLRLCCVNQVFSGLAQKLITQESNQEAR